MRRYLFLALVASAALWPFLALAQGAPGGETTPLRDMSNLALWSGIGGFVVPLVTAFVAQAHWKSPLRLAVFFVFACVWAAGTAYFSGDLTGADWLRSLLVVAFAGQAFFLVARPALKSIESATTVTKPGT